MNYKEQLEQGHVWTRCYRVEVSNPFNGTPSVNMMEETIISIAGETITKPGRLLTKTFNQNEVIELVNPMTGEPLGATITHQDIYVMFFSLWLKTAKDRDESETNFVLAPIAPEDVQTEPTVEEPPVEEPVIPPVEGG